jgi:hypothetical protein
MSDGWNLPGLVAAVEAYDPLRCRWEEKEPIPTPRSWVTVAAGLDGCIFGIGGRAGEDRLGQVETYMA